MDEKFIAEHIVDTPILLKKLMDDNEFEAALGLKKPLWRSAKEILKGLAETSENWFRAEE